MLVTHYYSGNLCFNRDTNSDKYLLLSAKLAPKGGDYRTQHISVDSSHTNFDVIFFSCLLLKGLYT
jgi:hypothetical protein